jgi:hypothetical protein
VAVNVVYGPLCDALGLASRQEVTETGHGPLIKMVGWASPASEYRSVQPEQIPVDLDHDHKPVGQVVHLERSRAGMLWCVAHVDERLRFASCAPERYFSSPPDGSASPPHGLR